jgi:signal transduction histidine kinase
VSTARRLIGIGGASAALAFILFAAYLGGWPDPGATTPYVLSVIVIAAGYLVVGHLASDQYPDRRIGLLFSVVGYLYLLRSVGYLYGTVTYAVGLATVSAYQAALAHLGMAWPTGRLRSRFEVALVVTIYVYNVTLNVVLQLFTTPRADGCDTCPENILLIEHDPTAIARIDAVTVFVSQGLTLTVVTVILRHWWTSEGYRRRSMNRLLLVAIPIAIYSAFVDLHARFATDLPDELVYAVAPLLLLAAPVAEWVELRRAAAARAAVGQALVQLDPGPTPAALQDALRDAVGDNEIRLALREDGRSGYRDVGGAAVDPARLPPGRTAVPLDTRADWVMVVDAQLCDEPELLAMVVAAARIALDHSRMRAEIQAQLAEVRESRARIVQAADAARRKLERDLHDGAQQRLVTLSLALGLARASLRDQDPEVRALLDAAAAEASAALAELRDLARGIHPAVLTESGLAGGVRALAERSPVRVTVAAMPNDRYPTSVEVTAYFLVAEGLTNVSKHAPGAAATVTIGECESTLRVEIADAGPGGAVVRAGSGLGGLADRVAAAGGRLEVRSPPRGGTVVRAVLPLTDATAVAASPEVAG